MSGEGEGCSLTSTIPVGVFFPAKRPASARPATRPPAENRSRHAADLRQLLLPAPLEAGGALTPAARPTPGAGPNPAGALAERVGCVGVADDQEDPARLRSLLLQDACRTATVRERTASDGTRTRIQWLAFGSYQEARPVFSGFRDNGDPRDGHGLRPLTPPGWGAPTIADLAVREAPAGGGTASPYRPAYLDPGDLAGVVAMTNPAGGPAAAFRRVVTLRSDQIARAGVTAPPPRRIRRSTPSSAAASAGGFAGCRAGCPSGRTGGRRWRGAGQSRPRGRAARHGARRPGAGRRGPGRCQRRPAASASRR
ncbi:hypothetical protein ACFXAF_33760 [Kitasatospora sp. NPDC059463]|uniref:hypothetical protein n=1 Tax=unclassified Kitasatospora TaxID=2633591 RepID=UPI0036BA47AD